MHQPIPIPQRCVFASLSRGSTVPYKTGVSVLHPCILASLRGTSRFPHLAIRNVCALASLTPEHFPLRCGHCLSWRLFHPRYLERDSERGNATFPDGSVGTSN